MYRALSIIIEAFRGTWTRVPEADEPTERITLFINNSGENVSVSVPVEGGHCITVLHDGSMIAPDGVPQDAIDKALEGARHVLAVAHVDAWF